MKKIMITLAVCAAFVVSAAADVSYPEGFLSIVTGHEQSSVELPLPGDYNWWYGCSPTAAGMMMGYYDVNGYKGKSYSNLVPGGKAENETFSGRGLVNDIIASQGHINDFYQGGYQASGDDLPQPWHDFDSLADFMGTSQDAFGLDNGATNFRFNAYGKETTRETLLYFRGIDNQFNDGMLGMCDYIEHAGYKVNEAFNQLTDVYSSYGGFTFDDYIAEIDAGRPMILHVGDTSIGHSIYGYGYDYETGEILFHDTWTLGEKRFQWDGTYMTGYGEWKLHSVSGIELAPVPVPSSVLLSSFGLSIFGWLRRRNCL